MPKTKTCVLLGSLNRATKKGVCLQVVVSGSNVQDGEGEGVEEVEMHSWLPAA